jgi:hypothetical protein
MSDSHTKRAVANLRARHEDKIRSLCEDIQANVGYALADLECGRVPRLRSILSDAQGIAERIAALNAAADVIGIYEAGESDR